MSKSYDLLVEMVDRLTQEYSETNFELARALDSLECEVEDCLYRLEEDGLSGDKVVDRLKSRTRTQFIRLYKIQARMSRFEKITLPHLRQGYETAVHLCE